MGSSSAEQASFSTTFRLLSCLVTESLVRAIFVPLQWTDCVGVGVVLNAPKPTIPTHNCKQEDVLAIVLLRHVPVLKIDSESSDELRGKEIGLLDPLDMFPSVLAISGDGEFCENEVEFDQYQFLWIKSCTLNLVAPPATSRCTIVRDPAYFLIALLVLPRANYRQGAERPFGFMGHIRHKYQSRPCYTFRHLRRTCEFGEVANLLVRPSAKRTVAFVP